MLGLWRIARPNSPHRRGFVSGAQVGLVTLVPRTCAVRQDLEAGPQQPAVPLLVESRGEPRAKRRAAGMGKV